MDDLKARLRTRATEMKEVDTLAHLSLYEAADRIEKLEAENTQLEQALRIEMWNERMLRGGKQDAVIAAISKKIASIKKSRATVSDNGGV